MFQNNNKISYLVFTLLVIGFLGFLTGPVSALTVSPPRIEVSGDPGSVIQINYFLINEGAEPRTLHSSFANFEAGDETGVPRFTESREGLATWMETLPQVTLQPREEKEVFASITIPQEAEPGGHFAAIFWGTSPPQAGEGGQVVIGGKVGILVLLRVSGEIEGGAGLLEFGTQEKRRFFTQLPIEFVWRFKNDGGDRVQPEGEIIIRNTLGLTSAKLPVNIGRGSVLPASVRRFTEKWDITREERGAALPSAQIEQNGSEETEGFWDSVKNQRREFRFGRYSAELNLKYGDNGQETASGSYSFFIIPWQFLSIIFTILIILGFLGAIGLKRYNRWIIKKAREGGFQ